MTCAVTLDRLLRERRGAGSVRRVEPTRSVSDAVMQLSGPDDSLLVIEDGRVVGLLTEHDVFEHVICAGRDPDTTSVRDVMTTEIATAAPTMTIDQAMTLLDDKHYRHLPVVQDGDVLGMVSLHELASSRICDQEAHINDLFLYITRS